VSTPDAPLGRGALLRRLVVFQIKLALDGLRDLLLSPVSVVAVVVGIVAGGDAPDRPFRRLLAFGRRTDRWIDLFETHGDPAAGEAASGDADGDDPPPPPDPRRSASSIIDSVERIVREEVARGGGLRGVEARLGRLRRGEDDPDV
jgi:hypothetical protein